MESFTFNLKVRKNDAFEVSKNKLKLIEKKHGNEFADECNTFLARTILDGSQLPGPVVQYVSQQKI